MQSQNTNTVEPTLYAAHKKIYPREVSGYFTRLRMLSVVVLLGIYYLMPFVLVAVPEARGQAVGLTVAGALMAVSFVAVWLVWPRKRR